MTTDRVALAADILRLAELLTALAQRVQSFPEARARRVRRTVDRVLHEARR